MIKGGLSRKITNIFTAVSWYRKYTVMSTKRGRTNLKIYKEPSWQLETTGVDGSVDLLPIYSVLIDDKEHQFVCEEQSNCVYNFFVYKY